MTVTLEQAKLQLEQLIERLVAGESLVITKGGKPVASLSPAADQPPGVHPPPRVPGSAKGLVRVSDDFDAPLDEFGEYAE